MRHSSRFYRAGWLLLFLFFTTSESAAQYAGSALVIRQAKLQGGVGERNPLFHGSSVFAVERISIAFRTIVLTRSTQQC